jgi:hypothetical protein
MAETLASGTVNADEGTRALRESSRLAEAGIVAQATLEGISDGTGRVRLAPRAGYGRDNGRVGVLDLLACATIPASPKGWCSPGGRTLVRQQGFDDEKAVELMVRCLMHT